MCPGAGDAGRAPPVLHWVHTHVAQRSPIQDRWPDEQAVLHHEEVIAMTSTRQRRQPSWRVNAALRRAADTLRYVNDELARASEAIFRPVGAPPPPAGTSATSATIVTGSAEAAATEHTGRAA